MQNKITLYYVTDADVERPDPDSLNKWVESFESSMDENARALYDAWVSYPNNLSIKVSTYFQAYSDLLSKYRNKKILLAEVGVLEGGSLLMWKKWLGTNSKVVGIDLNPEAKRFQTENIDIAIGDQANPEFWKNFFQTYPQVDILIDDGGHQFFQQVVTFFAVLMHAKQEIMIIFEDVNTSFFKDFRAGNGEESFFDFIKDLTDNLTLKQIFSKRYGDKWINDIESSIIRRFKTIRSVSFFSGMLAIVIDPKCAHIPLYLKNVNDEKKTEDYRHKGEFCGASFPWSNPKNKRTVKFIDPSSSGERKIVNIMKK